MYQHPNITKLSMTSTSTISTIGDTITGDGNAAATSQRNALDALLRQDANWQGPWHTPHRLEMLEHV
jgi:hypothetical protein